ncbi:MAG: START domain-containing protein [Campylobacterota bacterium]
MRLLMMMFTLFILCEADEWSLVKEKNGVTVHTREVNGSDFLEFRGETVVEASVGTLVAILYDTSNAPAWLHECSFGMTLEEAVFEENYIFQIYDLPFPVSDRQVILHSRLSWTQEGARLETQEANTYCDNNQASRCKRVTETDLIDIERSRGHYIFTPLSEKKTKVLWQQHVEPGGSIPTWLVNLLVVDIPFNTLLQLQTLVKDEKYRDMTEVKLRDMWSKQYQTYH